MLNTADKTLFKVSFSTLPGIQCGYQRIYVIKNASLLFVVFKVGVSVPYLDSVGRHKCDATIYFPH